VLERAVDLCARHRGGRVIILTGAGISAESGIPTFRGKDGYWTVGSKVYHPQELATWAAFQEMPDAVWDWYLYRRGVCRSASPNAAHRALIGLPIITQNVDGLHRRAGSEVVYEIHGNIDLARCADECTAERFPVPDDRRCPRCGGRARPHVLWFDESYDEERYHLDTVRALAAEAELLIVVGTSAQTNLPWQVVRLAKRAGASIIDVNVEDNPFGELADVTVRAPATEVVPAIIG
jgi:NAD-dependent deacetylase